MKRFALVAAVAAICFSFFGCHGDDTTWHVSIIKDIDSVDIDSDNCTATVCGTVQLSAREGVFVETIIQIFMGSDGMPMDDLLANLDAFLVKEVVLSPADADADGLIDVCVTIELPAGTSPVAVRAVTGNLFSFATPVGLVSCLGFSEDDPNEIKARLVLADRCDERDVARVLLANEGSDVPVLLNAKVLTLSLGEVTGSPELTFDHERSRGSCFQVDSFFDVFYDIELRGESFEGNFETIEATLDGNPIEVDIDEEDGTAEVEIETCQPGTYELVINMTQEFEFEVEIDTNEGEPNGDTTVIETEIVSLSLTASIPVLQDEHPLFGHGERVSRKLRIPSSCYADAFIDDQSNTGNRVVLVDKIAYGQGFGIGKAFGDIDLNVTSSAWYDDYLRTYGFGIGHFFDNNFPTIFGHEFGNEDYVFVPVVTHGYTEGDVEFELEASGYVELQVGVGVWVRVPITAHKDLDEYFVTHLAGRNAIGKPDCKAFGVGREAGHLTLAFCDNIVIDGPGYDLRIFERSTEDATEIFHGLIALDRFFVAQAPELQNFLPVDRSIELPTDMWAQDLTAPLGFVVHQDEYDCGYVIDIDLGVLADRLTKLIGAGAVPRPDCMNLLTVISDGAGNTIDSDFRELFFGADIDSVCGLNNRFGLRVLPTTCTQETEEEEVSFTFRDLFIEGLFFDEDDQEEEENCPRKKLWRYKLCADVYCDGLKADPLATNEVEVSTKLKPYFVRSHLKQNAVCGLARAADEAGEAFGLDIDD